MKVGVVFDHLDPRRGGAERCLFRLLEELGARGHEVVVYAQRPGPGPWRTRCAAPRRWLRGARERAFAEWATFEARSEGCAVVFGVRHVWDVDVYQPHGGTWAATVEGKDRARPAGVLRRGWRAVSGRHRVFSEADREVFARRPGMITLAMSDGVRADIEARYGRHQPDLRVVWPAVEAPGVHEREQRRRHFRREWGLGEGPVIVFAAHQFREKGLGPAIEALARCDRDLRMVVLGRGPRAPFQSLARHHGVAASLCFVGAQPESWSAFFAADLLLHPTYYDPCALVCLEALCVGLPVVTSRYNGAAALIGGRGQVVDDPAEVEGLARAIRVGLSLGVCDEVELPVDLSWPRHVDQVERALQDAAS